MEEISQNSMCEMTFAVLQPENIESKLGFDAVAKEAKRLNGCSDGRHMHIEPASTAYPQIQSFSDSESASSADHDSNDLVWGGYYFLCTCERHSPVQPLLGWVVGRGGRRSEKKNGGVDLRLHNKPTATLAAFHARFQFSKDGIFELATWKNHRPVTLDGITFASTSRVLRSIESTNVRFGNFAYSFRFTETASTKLWRKSYEAYLQLMNRSAPPDFVSPIPSPQDHIVGQWCISRTIASGTSGTVSVAKNLLDGSLVAVKRYQMKSSIRRREVEIRMLESLPKHDRLIKYVGQFAEGHSEGWVYLFMSPLAIHTLSAITDPSYQTSVTATQQILEGVELLHEAKIIHRDLKSENIGIKSMEPLSLFIFDFDCAWKQSQNHKVKPRRRSVGTRYCLAPEMEEELYGTKVDIWSCGIIAAQMHFYNNIAKPWTDVLVITHSPVEDTSPSSMESYILPQALLPEQAYQRRTGRDVRWKAGNIFERQIQFDRVCAVLPGLCSCSDDSLSNLIKQMLQCDPEKRWTATKALGHPCFSYRTKPANPPSDPPLIAANKRRNVSPSERFHIPSEAGASNHTPPFLNTTSSLESNMGVTNALMPQKSLSHTQELAEIPWVHFQPSANPASKQALAVGLGAADYREEP